MPTMRRRLPPDAALEYLDQPEPPPSDGIGGISDQAVQRCPPAPAIHAQGLGEGPAYPAPTASAPRVYRFTALLDQSLQSLAASTPMKQRSDVRNCRHL